MKTRFLMATAAAAIVMVACNNEETDNWAGEIRLSSGLETQQVTRSINTALQGGQIANGIKVGLFINEDVASDQPPPIPRTYHIQPMVVAVLAALPSIIRKVAMV